MIDQTAFLMLFFESRPDTEFDAYDVAEAVRHSWLAMTGEKYRDPDRKMRDLRDGGYLSSHTDENKVLRWTLRRPYNRP